VSAAEFGLAATEPAMKELQAKVEKDPMNPNGIVMLARSLAEMGRFPEAVQQYEKLVQIVPNEPEVWAEFADTAVMANGQSFLGKPTEYLDRALALDPNNTKALALSGMAAMERRDYAAAIKHWQALLQQMPNKDSEEARMIAGGVQRAHDLLMQQKGGKGQLPLISEGAPQQPAAAAPGAERVSGTVSLSPSLKAQADPNDTVFILARAANGPPMPLAVMRKQVKDLPLQFSLDDSMAMAPQMKLSKFDSVIVIARVSKSGNAMPQVGDLQGMSGTVKPGASGLKISIDKAL
jgi:cytochrome c-type biogenesis protein CcmH